MGSRACPEVSETGYTISLPEMNPGFFRHCDMLVAWPLWRLSKCVLLVFRSESYDSDFEQWLLCELPTACLESIMNIRQKLVRNIWCNFGEQSATNGSIVGWDTILQVGMSRVQFPRRSWRFFNLPNTFRRTEEKDLLSLYRIEYREQNKKCSWGVKRQPSHKADNLTAVCVPIT